MKRPRFSYLIFLFFLVESSTVFSQTKIARPESFYKRKAHTESEQQERRHERFAKMREDSLVAAPGKARWEAFSHSKAKMLSTPTVSAVANWQSMGPNNQAGRMISHAFDPNNPTTIWAGSASGGLWKSVNGGNSWQPMTDNLPNLAVGAIAINPQNTNEMLIGTGEGYLLSYWLQYGVGVLRSTDGGLTWLPTNLVIADSLEFACLNIVWDPFNANNVLLASTFGVYRSQDGGQTWTQTLNGYASSLVMNKKNSAIAYTSMQDYQSLPGGIFMTNDSGQTWQQLTNGIPSTGGYGFTTLAICDSFPNVLYAGVSQPLSSSNFAEMQGLYKSSNGGASWSQLNVFEDFYCYPPPYNYICQGWYGNITAVSPVDSNLVFSGGVYLYGSTDGGATWNYYDWAPAENPPYMHPDHHSFGFNPQVPGEVYSFNDGGVYKSTNTGQTWTLKNTDLVTTQFYYVASAATNSNLMLGGTQDNGIWSNFNTGTNFNWTQFVPGDGFCCNIDYTDQNTWYATELFSKRMKSRDGGLSWDSLNNGISGNNFFITPLIQHPTNPLTLACATDPTVYLSTDSGASWQPIINTPYVTIIAFDKVNPQVMYICNDPYFSVSNIRRTTDGGNTWTFISSPGNKVIDIECDPLVSGTLYATRGKYTSGQQIYKSVDFGNTWTNITNDYPAIPANTIAINPNNTSHLYVGSDLGVYLSIDGGFSWTSFNDNLPNVIVQDMHYFGPDSTVRIGTHGRGIWKTKAADPMLIGTSEVKNNSAVLSVFPNPSQGHFNITSTLNKPGKIIVKILNQLGQEVAEVYNGTLPAGKFTLQWNGKNSKGQSVSNGIYFVRMMGSEGAKTTKVIFDN